MMSAVPRTVPFSPDHVPIELTRRRQWVCWRWRKAREEWTKTPINPRTGTLASHADPSTWSTFEDALEAAGLLHVNGIGYVFSADDPYTGIDLDDCVNPATGDISEWAADIIERSESYAEISPSGTGVKVIVRGSVPGGKGRKRTEIEIYDRLRFFTITGKRVTGASSTITEQDELISELHQRYFPDKKPSNITALPLANPPSHDDQWVIERATAARNGAKFQQLFAGDTSGYGSQSEADLALCSMIAFWTGPLHDRIDSIYRQSALYRPKWEREDYRLSTMTMACDRAEYWEPASENDPIIVFDKVAADHASITNDLPEYPYLVQVADGLKEPRKPDVWIVDRILRDESVQLIVGPPKTYKSFFAQELSIAVATGTPMFGEFSTREPRRVLYVQEESARQHLWARYEGILNGRGMHGDVLRDQLWAITNQGVRLDDEQGLERFLRNGVEACEPSIVIFDPLREMHWQDENKAEAMMPILRVFKTLRDRYKVSVAIIHHNNKNPLYTSPADSIRGTSAIWAAMDGAVFIGTTEQEKVMKVVFNLKEGGQAEPFLYSIKDDDDAIRFNVIPIDGPAKRFDRMEIVSWARERDQWFSIENAIDAMPASDSLVRRAIRDLVKTGHLLERPARFGKKEYAHLEVIDDATF